MLPIPRKSRAWPVVGAFLTLLAIGWCAPPRVEAGCDHPADRPGFGIDLPPGDATAGEPRPTPRPKPAACDGPQCSGKSAPPATTEPQVPPNPAHWGLLDRPDPDGRPGSTALAVEDALASPLHLAPAIFHPPRPAR